MSAKRRLEDLDGGESMASSSRSWMSSRLVQHIDARFLTSTGNVGSDWSSHFICAPTDSLKRARHSMDSKQGMTTSSEESNAGKRWALLASGDVLLMDGKLLSLFRDASRGLRWATATDSLVGLTDSLPALAEVLSLGSNGFEVSDSLSAIGGSVMRCVLPIEKLSGPLFFAQLDYKFAVSATSVTSSATYGGDASVVASSRQLILGSRQGDVISWTVGEETSPCHHRVALTEGSEIIQITLVGERLLALLASNGDIFLCERSLPSAASAATGASGNAAISMSSVRLQSPRSLWSTLWQTGSQLLGLEPNTKSGHFQLVTLLNENTLAGFGEDLTIWEKFARAGETRVLYEFAFAAWLRSVNHWQEGVPLTIEEVVVLPSEEGSGDMIQVVMLVAVSQVLHKSEATLWLLAVNLPTSEVSGNVSERISLISAMELASDVEISSDSVGLGANGANLNPSFAVCTTSEVAPLAFVRGYVTWAANGTIWAAHVDLARFLASRAGSSLDRSAVCVVVDTLLPTKQVASLGYVDGVDGLVAFLPEEERLAVVTPPLPCVPSRGVMPNISKKDLSAMRDAVTGLIISAVEGRRSVGSILPALRDAFLCWKFTDVAEFLRARSDAVVQRKVSGRFWGARVGRKDSVPRDARSGVELVQGELALVAASAAEKVAEHLRILQAIVSVGGLATSLDEKTWQQVLRSHQRLLLAAGLASSLAEFEKSDVESRATVKQLCDGVSYALQEQGVNCEELYCKGASIFDELYGSVELIVPRLAAAVNTQTTEKVSVQELFNILRLFLAALRPSLNGPGSDEVTCSVLLSSDAALRTTLLSLLRSLEVKLEDAAIVRTHIAELLFTVGDILLNTFLAKAFSDRPQSTFEEAMRTLSPENRAAFNEAKVVVVKPLLRHDASLAFQLSTKYAYFGGQLDAAAQSEELFASLCDLLGKGGGDVIGCGDIGDVPEMAGVCFATRVFKWLAAQRRYGDLLRAGGLCPVPFESFLTTHVQLQWVHRLSTQQYAACAESAMLAAEKVEAEMADTLCAISRLSDQMNRLLPSPTA